MREIGIGHSPNFSIPTWNFKGICLEIDSRPAAEKIIFIINAGISQIGAEIIRPPITYFEKAVDAYALKLGIVRNKVSMIYFLASYIAKQFWILNAKIQTKDELHQFGAAHLLL